MPNHSTPARLKPLTSMSWVEEHLDQILDHAILSRASDIHLEPHDGGLQIRERRDGHLYVSPSPPNEYAEGVVSRLKILAKMDIAERRLPQDGQCSYQSPTSNIAVDLRVSTIPTTMGEKVVIRILDGAQVALELSQLGFSTQQFAVLLQALHQPQGLILNTGPTGAGKTLTLYSCLRQLLNQRLNISTVEDPCEINLAGVNQVNVHERIGLTFEAALRALMRQDPDVIMIGEIRDSTTAEMAIKAAQTGHLVLSSIHTNDAPSTLARLMYMGIPGFHIGASVTLVCAQRLLRRLCLHCRQAVRHPTARQSYREQGDWYKAVGCERCLGGYSGRIGAFELMPLSPELGQALLTQPDVGRFTRIARDQGVQSLRDAALSLVDQGLTSWEEVITQTPNP